MGLSPAQKYAVEVAKEITIAKLSAASPNGTSKEVGEAIGEMFMSIYQKIYELGSSDDSE